MQLFIFLTFCLAVSWADVSHIVGNQHDQHHHHDDHQHYESTTSPPGPPNPYVFSYQAGRAPGHVDRQHTEVSDGTGVVRGAFSYVDPKNQVRTVQYVADEHGFHPQLSHELEDSEAVKAAKQKHFDLYNRIAQEHAAGGIPVVSQAGPQQSEAVIRATNKHLSLYERIAAQHAAIGAQHEAARLAFEATSEHSIQPEDNSVYYQKH
uniref:Uncharacterized protein n=1 Tax=Glossina brevipalpis TaxID=37001 RepID=A0A1A9W0T3_9MUSC